MGGPKILAHFDKYGGMQLLNSLNQKKNQDAYIGDKKASQIKQ